MRTMMKLCPDVIDCQQLKRKEMFKNSACLENEAEIEIFFDTLLEISLENINIVI